MRKSICHNAEYVRQRCGCSSACKCVAWALRESLGSFGCYVLAAALLVSLLLLLLLLRCCCCSCSGWGSVTMTLHFSWPLRQGLDALPKYMYTSTCLPGCLARICRCIRICGHCLKPLDEEIASSGLFEAHPVRSPNGVAPKANSLASRRRAARSVLER